MEPSNPSSEKVNFENNDESANSFVFYVAISFFLLIPFALVGAFNNVSFLISFAFSGLFFTLHQMFIKKSSSSLMLFLGILFTITVPQILQLKFIHSFLEEIIFNLNKWFSFEISSASISNALTIASLGLVLFGLSNNYKKLKEVKVENEKLVETVNKQNNWKIKFEQINQLEEIEEQISELTYIVKTEKESKVLENAYFIRGNIYRKNNKLHKALADYEESIKLNPKDPLTHFARAFVFNNMGEKQKSIEGYTKAIELKPDYAMAYNNRGIGFSNLGKPEEAIKDYTKAIELNSEDAEIYYNRGNALSSLGKPEEAIKDYTKAIELDPKDAEAYNNRGTEFSSLGKSEEAIKDYTKAIELNPQYMSKLDPIIIKLNLNKDEVKM